ncbi:hypothetical protein QTO34_015282 [Cnephaeus nilssonii]|uniref:Microtubule-associated protein 1S n=1 Tax=Cnephaeus nilssonii TaxID=3371016 RepID=A0AA40I3T7_CNENI|nr:hypothetical protein QTO34_015282 [Eptesicus nilssonii]
MGPSDSGTMAGWWSRPPSWDIDPGICSLDEQLKIFVSRHSATFSSLVKGQRSLHLRGDALDILVLLNPSDKSLCDELRNLLLDPAPHKLLVLAGPCLEETGELLLQTGGFSPRHFLQVLRDKEIRDLLASAPPSADPPKLTITCPTFGDWAQLAPEVPGLQGGLRLRLNPPVQRPASEGLREFLEYVAESLELPSPFELLEPPASVGFLRLARPCCYIFPGGLGDAAFFAVNGFTMLVNGGSNPKSSFWKLVRHLDRVDAVLVTHAGADSLPGLNSLLRRKLAEQEEAATGGGSGEDRLRRLVSPSLGVVFLNARGATSRLVRGEDEAELARSLLARLGIEPLPLSRGLTPTEPTVLFQKMGVGRLDMYVLHPPSAGAERTLASVCALLVWHPTGPTEKVVRVLFPGCTPPARLLDGLVRLQHLGFLREPVVTPQDLTGPRRTESKESVGSRDSLRREGRTSVPARPAQERSGVARKEPPRSEASRRAEKEARHPGEVKKDPKPSAPRTQPRELSRASSTVVGGKKAGAQAAAKPRRAPNNHRPGAPLVGNGPHSPPSFRCGEASPSIEACSSPVPQLVATPSQGSSLELGLSPTGEDSSSLKTQEQLVASCTPPPCTPSPAGAPQGPAEGSRQLSLSPLRGGEAGPDGSPTVTTPSLPAEVGSPHSTEVDESLSVSFEQVLPPPPVPMSEAGARSEPSDKGGEHPYQAQVDWLGGHNSAGYHIVLTQLLSKGEASHNALMAHPYCKAPPLYISTNTYQTQLVINYEALVLAETSLVLLSSSFYTIVDAQPLSDHGQACGLPFYSVDSNWSLLAGAHICCHPPPVPSGVPPLPAAPRLHMQKPTTLDSAHTALVHSARPLSEPSVSGCTQNFLSGFSPASLQLIIQDGFLYFSCRCSTTEPCRPDYLLKYLAPRTGGGGDVQSFKSHGSRFNLRLQFGCPLGAKRNSWSGVPSTGRGWPLRLLLSVAPRGSVCLLNEEFFRRVRSLCYVISGQDQHKEEGMRAVLDALLAGKQQWDRDLQELGTWLPTQEARAGHMWSEKGASAAQGLGITVLGSNSTVSMQDEAFPACKVEF